MGFYEKYLCLCNSINKSPSAVALELKIGKPSVTRWKNGATPRDATVLKIADYFGVTVTELMAGVEEQKEAPGISAEGAKETISNFISTTNDRTALLAIISEASKKLQELE